MFYDPVSRYFAVSSARSAYNSSASRWLKVWKLGKLGDEHKPTKQELQEREDIRSFISSLPPVQYIDAR
jgi:hypothetical protein